MSNETALMLASLIVIAPHMPKNIAIILSGIQVATGISMAIYKTLGVL
jgi:hypothetical protein